MKKVFALVILYVLQANLFGQANFDFYLSNAGNDANNGTLDFPKRSIAGLNGLVSAGPVAGNNCLNIGFKSGDIFYETFNPGYPVHAGTYFKGADKKFAVLNGAKDYSSGWQRYGNGNLYFQTITLKGFTGYGINNIGGYSFVYVFEIDRQLELTAPVTARRMLKFSASLAVAMATPGTFYEPSVVNVNVDTVSVYIHASDGSNPNNNPRYRYEVCTIDRAINSTYQENNRFERLWVTGYGAGNGMIPAGANTQFNRMIFGPGAGIHHLGLRGAVINNSLFLPGPKNTNGYAVVFYDVQGYNRHNTIRNTLFMDIKYPIYTHHSNGTNFGALELDNVIAFADTTEAKSFLESMDTDSALVSNVYSDGYPYGYNYVWAKYASIKNSVFKDVRTGIAFPYLNALATINNNYIRVTNVPNVQQGYGISLSRSNRVIVSNNIIHFKAPPVATPNSLRGYMIYGTGIADRFAEVSGNIFICDVAAGSYVIMAKANTDTGSRTSRDKWKNNVYILVNGDRIEWRVSNAAVNNGSYIVNSLQQWKQQTNQDKNSLYFDLRNDPRGLKAIFVDPDNGDYTLTNSAEANAIKAIRAGMVNPITCFLKKPSYEQAVDMVMNDGVLTAGACRNPCSQSNIRTANRLSTNLAGNNTVNIDWQIADESAVDHYEIMRSFGSNDFATIASLPAKNNFNYSFSDQNVMAGITYRYSVAVVTRLNEKCYSELSTVKTNDSKPVNIYPNPSGGKINVGLNAYTGPVTIRIHNAMGIKLYEKEVTAYYGVPVLVDLSNKPRGYYIISVMAGDQTSKQGFVLQ